MKKLKKIAITTFTALAVVPAGLATAEQTRTHFNTVSVTTSLVGGDATVGGTVIPFKEVTLVAQMPGRVTFLAGVEGYKAKDGDVLFKIDDTELQARRRAAAAQVYQAESALRNSQMQYSRELYAPRTNSITSVPGMGIPATFDQFFTRGFANTIGNTNTGLERQADLYAQGAGISQAQSALLQAQANLDAIDARLRDTQATAPFDGMLVQKMVEVGDTVQPGMPLAKYAYTDYLRIVADVPVRLAAGLTVGMIVPARIDAANGVVDARVAQVFPVADPVRHTVRVKFDLPNDTFGGPGMYVEITIPDSSVPTRSQAAVPESALVWRGSLPSVFILEDGKPSLRLVRVGYPMGDGRVAVMSGLKGDEQVIVNPPASLVSGE